MPLKKKLRGECFEEIDNLCVDSNLIFCHFKEWNSSTLCNNKISPLKAALKRSTEEFF